MYFFIEFDIQYSNRAPIANVILDLCRAEFSWETPALGTRTFPTPSLFQSFIFPCVLSGCEALPRLSTDPAALAVIFRCHNGHLKYGWWSML